MSIKGRKRTLALYRLQQAEESLDEASYLFTGNKSPRSVINRIYYAMFYSVLALLIFEEYSSSKHSGVLSYFNRQFIKKGLIGKELGRALNKAFDMRLRVDYREQVEITSEQVEPFFVLARNFIDACKNFLENKGCI